MSLDATTLSGAVGGTKPDPRMFETALEKAGSAPARSPLIGWHFLFKN